MFSLTFVSQLLAAVVLTPSHPFQVEAVGDVDPTTDRDRLT